VKRSAVSKYESGSIPLTDETILTLADRFGVSTDYLLGHTDVPNPVTDSINLDTLEYALFDEVRELDDKSKETRYR